MVSTRDCEFSHTACGTFLTGKRPQGGAFYRNVHLLLLRAGVTRRAYVLLRRLRGNPRLEAASSGLLPEDKLRENGGPRHDQRRSRPTRITETGIVIH